MDKKSKFTQPSSNKGAAGESKKNQDVNGKVFPKTSRRREPPSANGCSKNEQPRKSSVQKTRSFDKRPKPKGQYHGGTKENTKVDNEEMAEHGSVMVPGSKKQNLNHLLNFHYEPREVQGSSGGWSYGRSSKNYNNSNRWLPSVQRHKYNKELFLQANCQFVVNIDGDYSVYLVDPDILVDWKLIEQIKVHTSESLLCPICLNPPVAGRMTRCGHVYCWPCILHYLSLSDKSWRKCPICYESVCKSDLKSVIEITQNPINIGDNIKLRLMRRKRGSLLAIPVPELTTITTTTANDPETFLRVTENPSSQIYSKLLLANTKDILEIIDLERTHLNIDLMEDPSSPENCFIEQALEELSQREINITKQSEKHEEEKTNCTIRKIDGKNHHNTVEEYKNVGINDSEHANGEKDHEEASSPSQNLSKYFYFYQAEDGQHVYLHAMNIKMLELQYGSLDNCPRTINGKLIEKESGSFTEDLRKRMRYLCHLPLTCGFDIAEIDLDVSLISEEVKGLFREQVEVREKRRKRRDREEKKREKKINAEENRKMGKFPTPRVHIESTKHFPQWQSEPQSSSMAIPTPPESVAASSIASSPARSSFDDESVSLVDESSWNASQNDPGPSFAQMLRNEGSRMTSTVTWPSIAHLSNSKKSENGAWGRKTATPSYEDEYGTASACTQSFGDVLAQALEQSELLGSSFGHEEVGLKKSKKKKRGKATVLFATGMSRSS